MSKSLRFKTREVAHRLRALPRSREADLSALIAAAEEVTANPALLHEFNRHHGIYYLLCLLADNVHLPRNVPVDAFLAKLGMEEVRNFFEFVKYFWQVEQWISMVQNVFRMTRPSEHQTHSFESLPRWRFKHP